MASAFLPSARHAVFASLFMLALAACGAARADEPSPEKARLIARLLTLWHPEQVVVAMVQRPAADAVQQARIALQGRVSDAKRDATVKDLTTDAQRFVDEATPIAQASAARQMAGSVGAQLDSNFSEDELRQLIALFESPVKKKFEQLVPQMEHALGDKVGQDAGATIQPKLEAMTKAIALKLRGAVMTP